MATLTAKTIVTTTGFKIKEVHAREDNFATVLLENDSILKVAEGSRRIEAGDYVEGGDTHYTAGEIALLFTVS